MSENKKVLVNEDHNGNYIYNAKTTNGEHNDSLINKKYVDDLIKTKQSNYDVDIIFYEDFVFQDLDDPGDVIHYDNNTIHFIDGDVTPGDFEGCRYSTINPLKYGEVIEFILIIKPTVDVRIAKPQHDAGTIISGDSVIKGGLLNVVKFTSCITSWNEADGSVGFMNIEVHTDWNSIINTLQSILTFDSVPTAGSEKLVKSGDIFTALNQKQNKTLVGSFINPNTIAEWGTVTAKSQFTNPIELGQPIKGEKCEYCIKFNTGATLPALTFPSYISWREDLILEPNTHYVILINYEGGKMYADWSKYEIPQNGGEAYISFIPMQVEGEDPTQMCQLSVVVNGYRWTKVETPITIVAVDCTSDGQISTETTTINFAVGDELTKDTGVLEPGMDGRYVQSVSPTNIDGVEFQYEAIPEPEP